MLRNIPLLILIIYLLNQFLGGCTNNSVAKYPIQQNTTSSKEETSLEKDVKDKAIKFTVKIITKNGAYSGIIITALPTVMRYNSSN